MVTLAAKNGWRGFEIVGFNESHRGDAMVAAREAGLLVFLQPQDAELAGRVESFLQTRPLDSAHRDEPSHEQSVSHEQSASVELASSRLEREPHEAAVVGDFVSVSPTLPIVRSEDFEQPPRMVSDRRKLGFAADVTLEIVGQTTDGAIVGRSSVFSYTVVDRSAFGELEPKAGERVQLTRGADGADLARPLDRGLELER